MNVSQALLSRVSAHSFGAGEITKETLLELLSLAHLSPTAYHLQNYRFDVVHSDKARRVLYTASWHQEKILQASAVIVISGDLLGYEQHGKKLKHAVDNQTLSQETAYVWEQQARQCYHENVMAQTVEAVRSASMVAMSLMLAAQEQGYASCPMSGFEVESVRQLCGLSQQVLPVMLVALGHQDDSKPRPQKTRCDIATLCRFH